MWIKIKKIGFLNRNLYILKKIYNNTQKYIEVENMALFKKNSDRKKQKAIRKREEIMAKFQQNFGIDLSDKTWFRCTLEELIESTFFKNKTERGINTAYVVIYDNYIEIYKESGFINKSNRGHHKIFFNNITSIDRYNGRKSHFRDTVMINTKSGERAVQLNHVREEYYQLLCSAYDTYMENELNNNSSNVIQENSNADELLKWHDLYKQGIISEEEFANKKAELL